MNKSKKFLTLIMIIIMVVCALALAMTFYFFASNGKKNPCDTHLDKNNDGICDKCEIVIPTDGDILLINNKKAEFQIVYEKNLRDDAVYAIKYLQKSLQNHDIDVDVVEESENNIKKCEILIGNIKSRGEDYSYSGKALGLNGYIFKIFNSRVIINSGSTVGLIDAIVRFKEDVLQLNDKTSEITNVTMKTSQQAEVFYNNYKLNSLKINNQSITDYNIQIDTSNPYHYAAAEVLRKQIKERLGYDISIVNGTGDGKSITFKSVSKNLVDEGFQIRTNSNNQMVVECAYDNKIKDAINDFIITKLANKKGSINFSGTVFKDDISFVTYREFGAKGDGIVHDYVAIKNTHDFANISGQTVKATPKKTYRIYDTRINGSVTSVSVKTNVDWSDANFIIDDSNISSFDKTKLHQKHIFNIESDYADETITDRSVLSKFDGIGKGTTNINLNLNYPAMITIYNSKNKVYKRKGYSNEEGSDQHEILLLDKFGNINPSTPWMFDKYEEVTSIMIHRVDVEPITIKGGSFLTKASNINIYDADQNKYNKGNFARGISVKRPGTVLDGVEHYITNEIPLNEQSSTNVGPSYNGFFCASGTSDVTFKNLVFTGRRAYSRKEVINIDGTVQTAGTSGTYDFTADGVNNIVLENCIQSNFYMVVDKNSGVTTTFKQINNDNTVSFGVEHDGQKHIGFTVKYNNGIPEVEVKEGATNSMAVNPSYGARICWGIGGTNFCKNMAYKNSVMSRFDAHCGLLNGTITGSTINTMSLVGKGEFIIENSTWIGMGAGAASNALIYLRDDYGSPWEGNIKIKDVVAIPYDNDENDFGVIYHHYKNWDFGYICYFPNITIDNLEVKNKSHGEVVNLIYATSILYKNSNIHLEYISPGEKNNNPVVPPEEIRIEDNNYLYYIPNVSFFETTDLSGSYTRIK